MKREQDKYFRTGLSASIVAHIALAVFALNAVGPDLRDFGKPMVYSVSIEGSSKIGGISQVPKDDKKKQMAPPKAVEEQKQAEKANVPSEAPEDAEVSIAEATPVPTEKPKDTPKPRPTPKKKATPKQQAKPRATPKKKVTKPKAAPRKKEPSLAEINKKLQAAMQRYTGESTDAGGKGFGSAGGSGNGMGGGAQRPPEFFTYMKKLEFHIKAGWRWHNTSDPLVARVCFKITPAGELQRVRMCGSSGNREYDDSVLRAVHKSNPAPVPPPAVYHFFKDVRMTFNPID